MLMLMYLFFSNFVLLGDFNMNMLDSNHPMFHKVQILVSSLCLSQGVTEPTRESST